MTPSYVPRSEDPGRVDALRPGLFAWRIDVAFATHNGLGLLDYTISGLTARPIRSLSTLRGHGRPSLDDHARLASRVAASALHGRDSHPRVYGPKFQVLLLPLWPGFLARCGAGEELRTFVVLVSRAQFFKGGRQTRDAFPWPCAATPPPCLSSGRPDPSGHNERSTRQTGPRTSNLIAIFYK